jgi:hypothetical protein
MKKSTLAIALSLAGLAAGPVAALELDGRPFVGFTWGETSSNYHTGGRVQAMMPTSTR